MRRGIPALAAVVVASILSGPGIAGAAPTPDPYQANDGTGFYNILPPGSIGNSNAVELGQFLTAGNRPAHNDDQLDLYAGLIKKAPGLASSEITSVFKDASFGVPTGQVERTYSPRGDVTIVRDTYGVPHIYGLTREAAEFGAGYAAAEDRLFFMDVLRHAGRAQLSSFAGGANIGMDEEVWADSPYTEADLERQFNYTQVGYEQEIATVRGDANAYVAGINAYINAARINPALMPGEYAAINQPLGPDPWKLSDLVSSAALVGGIFGKGGGDELASTQVLQAAQARFGAKKGRRVWTDFRDPDDPEAPTTVKKKRFPYLVPNRRQVAALPDKGTLKLESTVVGRRARADRNSEPVTGAEDIGSGLLDPLLAHEGAASNAVLVSGRETKTGTPLAVFGPQVAYFSPQILDEVDIHAPGFQSRGVGFDGLSLYTLLGRGPDYAWSATSASNDIIDTFAVNLCEPGGGTPTINSMSYMYKGQCIPFEVLERTDSWVPTAADSHGPGSETLRALRSKLGIVAGRALIKGKPIAYTRLRATYMHEVDSVLGFERLNNPDLIRNARDFQKAVSLITFTFNWFYVDKHKIAYFNSGSNPIRNRRASVSLPVPAKYPWRGYDPELAIADVTPFKQHPQVINQRTLVSWNNKQAHGYGSADGQFSYTPNYRSQALEWAINKRIKGKKKVTLAQTIDAMAEAATEDLRARTALPLVLDVLQSKKVKSKAMRGAIAAMRSWVKAGGHRIDRNGDGTYEHSDAIRVLDAWWPGLVRAEFEPTLGEDLYQQLTSLQKIDDPPNAHLGSAYNGGFYGYVNKDLRTILHRKVVGRFSRIYCGSGKLGKCRGALMASLKDAIGKNPYGENSGCGVGDDQMCFDAIHFRATGGITQPDIPWQNRPTFQQAVQVGHSVPR